MSTDPGRSAASCTKVEAVGALALEHLFSGEKARSRSRHCLYPGEVRNRVLPVAAVQRQQPARRHNFGMAPYTQLALTLGASTAQAKAAQGSKQ